MKIKKYGYSNFNKTTKLSFAVVVPNQDENGLQSWRFVTDIDFNNNIWLAENHKKAYLFDCKESAQDFVIGLAYSFYAGYVVEVLENMEISNNW